MRKKALSIGPCILIIALGLAVIAGWLTHTPILLRYKPTQIPEVFNTGFCFVLIGYALLYCKFPSKGSQRGQIILGAVLLLFGLLTLSQDLFNINLGIDQLFIHPWIANNTMHPGRCGSNTSLAFAITGLIFILMPFANNRIAAIITELALFSLLVISSMAAMSYFFDIKFLYGWNSFNSMSAYTVSTLLLTSITLWRAWRENPYSDQLYRGREDQKITLVCTFALLYVGGMFAIIQQVSSVVPMVLFLVLLSVIMLRIEVMPLVQRLLDAEKELLVINRHLRESEERYVLAVNGSSVGLWDWEVGTENMFCSPYLKKIVGYEDDELPNNSRILIDNLHPDDYPRVMDEIRNHIVNQVPYKVEYRLRCKNGEYHWFEAIGEAIRDENGYAVRMAGSLKDISDRKKVEQMKNEFVSVVSHELRTPITSIRGSLSLLQGGVAGEFSQKAKSLLTIANNNCERLLRLINDILDMEKIEAGKMAFKFKAVDITKLVKDSIIANHMYGEKFNVKIQLGESLENIFVNVDPDRLMQVLDNLISNAVKFSGNAGVVKLKTEVIENHVRVSVIDHGVGIPVEFQRRIFQKFSQADSSNVRDKGGTGLGLSISKSIIEKFGGTLNFVSFPGTGTTFYFDLLPCKALEPTSDQLPLGIVVEHPRSALVCEDDIDQSKYLAVLLEDAGFKVDVAGNASETKSLLLKNEYDVLLLDIILPDKDGIAFIHELRDDPKTETLPIVVLSAIAQTSQSFVSEDEASRLMWLDKPIDGEILLHTIHTLLEMHVEESIE